MKELDEIKGIKKYTPEGAFYLFPDVSHYFGMSAGDRQINTDSDLCLYLLEEANVALVPGSAFGSPNNIRISYAASDEELKKALDRLKTYLNKLK